jgi:hypothetical protein
LSLPAHEKQVPEGERAQGNRLAYLGEGRARSYCIRILNRVKALVRWSDKISERYQNVCHSKDSESVVKETAEVFMKSSSLDL